MRYLKVILGLIALLSVFMHLETSFAQRPDRGGQRNTSRILSGLVVDGQADPVPYASIVVRSKRDTGFLKGAATDVDGRFELRLRPGRFKVTISFLSYQSKTVDVSLKEGDVDMGTIVLKPRDELMDEVIIQADKSYMELKLDRRVYNVSKDPNNAGSNAQEILETIPSVEVDVDGTVSLRGSENVRILIDGKPSGLTGISSQDALRQLPGNLINRIEVITNASARYDAEGEAGIINIVLQKEKRSGLNGSFEVNVGYPHNYGASANLNYRTGKVNLFAGVGVRYRKRELLSAIPIGRHHLCL